MKKVQSGEVYLANLDPVKGSEQGRTRPIIVLQNPSLARYTSTALCVPLTSNTRRLGIPGTCFVKKGEGGLTQESLALGFQMRVLDTVRLKKKLGKLSPAALDNVADAVLHALGIVIE